ncbi:serine/threonine kinase [Nakamurella flava]|uniref:Serine/threonine kinase n=1 Tax=Nakamurella flava TaxID=2576308 RepID=A0A4U6QE26_9ACTN|nr:serine/threonine kinase [Nakamurella flava]TKV58301.1 serine/threonine kinase [Nakamurella flava]
MSGDQTERSPVLTPRLVGLSVDDAGGVASRHQVCMVRENPDTPGEVVAVVSDGVTATVLSQCPPTGTAVFPGSAVTVTWREDGGDGVREPRRPSPDPLVMSRMRSVDADDSVRSASSG